MHSKHFQLSQTASHIPALQLVTHLCYSDFADIMSAIHAMDGGWEERALPCAACTRGCPAGRLTLCCLSAWTHVHVASLPTSLHACLSNPHTADVLTIENSRSDNEMIRALAVSGAYA